MLGSDNVSSIAWQNLDEKFATVQLFGKLANVFADLPSSSLRDTGIFKAITGEDWISAQHKYRDYFSFKPFARLLFSCNNMPSNYSDNSDGFYRRLIVINFDHVIEDHKKDKHLIEKFTQELDGIVAWSLLGLKRLMANNYKFSETVRTRQALDGYRQENSSALAFVAEKCEKDTKSLIRHNELYRAYTLFSSEINGKPMSRNKFNKELLSIKGVAH